MICNGLKRFLNPFVGQGKGGAPYHGAIGNILEFLLKLFKGGDAKTALLVLSCLLAGVVTASAQDGPMVAAKTNLLYDATLSPNLGVEVGLAPRWTLDVSGNLNLWTVGDGHKWRHWLVQPEVRYWLCQRFAGHFFGFHAIGMQYNMGNLDLDFKFLGTNFRNLKDRRYQGWGAGAGVAYGYSWPISRRWNIEAEFGFGWIWTRYDSYPCAECGSKIDDGRVHNYVGPTKIAVNLEYVF